MNFFVFLFGLIGFWGDFGTKLSQHFALRDMFDSNGDGKFDGSNAKCFNFKVMVTNADGSTTAKTLSELGITAINLKADTTQVTYADGSAIEGQTRFTRSNGTTGIAAATMLAADAQGYAANDNHPHSEFRRVA